MPPMPEDQVREIQKRLDQIETKVEIVHSVDKAVALIQQMLEFQTKTVDENKDSVESLRQSHENLKLKVYGIAAAVSTVVTVGGFVVDHFLP